MSHSTMTVHLGKARNKRQRMLLDIWAEDALRLSNQVRWLMLCRSFEAPPNPQTDLTKNKIADKKLLEDCMAAWPACPEKTPQFLPPAFLKWLCAGSCVQFPSERKSHFAALPTKIAQGIIDRACDEWKGFFASLTSWKKDPSRHTGRPREPGFLTGRTLPSLSVQPGTDRHIGLVRSPAPGGRERMSFAFGRRKKPGEEAGDVRIAMSLTVPKVYAGKELRMIRFVPVGGTVRTGKKTSHGKEMFRAVSWKMELVFETETPQDGRDAVIAMAAELAAAASAKGKTLTSKGAMVMAARAVKNEGRKTKAEAAEKKHSALMENLRSALAKGELPVAAVDPGIFNVITAGFLDGSSPLAFRGACFTGLNQLRSKIAAKEFSKETGGAANERGLAGFWNENLGRMSVWAREKSSQAARLIAKQACDEIIKRKVLCVFIGKGGREWKDSVSNGKRFNQRFCQIPHEKILSRMEEILSENGILTFRVGEAFTSASSFLDGEALPALKDGKSTQDLKSEGVFRGSREGRRFVREGGRQIHSDANGCCNIARRGLAENFGFSLDGQQLFKSFTRQEKHQFCRPVVLRAKDLKGNRPSKAGAGTRAFASMKTPPQNVQQGAPAPPKETGLASRGRKVSFSVSNPGEKGADDVFVSIT